MNIVNPLSAPLAVLVAGLLLVGGSRLVGLPFWAMLPVAVVVAFALAPFLQPKPKSPTADPGLDRELATARERATELAQKANGFYSEATRLLTAPGQVEALAIVQYARSRVQELPARVQQLADRFQGGGSLLSVQELEGQLQEVERQARGYSGLARGQYDQLATSLRRNIGLAREGQDARLAQVTAINTLILDTAGALQTMQNRLRTVELPQMDELRSLDEQLTALSTNVDLLVGEPGGPVPAPRPTQDRRSFIASAAIAAGAVGLSLLPVPGLQRTLVVVSGTELQEPLLALKAKFERQHSDWKLDLKFQGSQDIVNRYIDDKNDFIPAVLIPANGQILKELEARWRSQNNEDPFYDPARPVASTMLVAVAWSERGKALFPDGRFRWGRLEQALKAQTWAALGGPASWGSFDFVLTDPSRSNSAQLALALLSGGNPNNPANPALFSLVKASVYNPPRSTDILLQEFIARGPNDADVAIVYESIALNRWEQSATNQGKPYQIYYLDPTYRTTSTAAIVRRRVDARTADAARTFLDFLGQPEQQAVFVRHGFRPATDNLDVAMVPGSPWNKTIPGARAKPAIQILSPPNPSILEEIKKLWSRSN